MSPVACIVLTWTDLLWLEFCQACLSVCYTITTSWQKTFKDPISVMTFCCCCCCCVIEVISSQQNSKFPPINTSLCSLLRAVETYFYPANSNWSPSVMQPHALTVRYDVYSVHGRSSHGCNCSMRDLSMPCQILFSTNSGT